MRALPILLLLLLLRLARGQVGDAAIGHVDDGGWRTEASDVVPDEGKCNIERHDAATFTQAPSSLPSQPTVSFNTCALFQKEFEQRYATKEPVILFNVRGSEEFRRLCRRDEMLSRWGHREVILASANAHSYKKASMSLRRYVEEQVVPQRLDRAGNETFYLFGDIDREEWDDLLRHYSRPSWAPAGHKSELSFGLAGAGSGVPFHIHGPGWAEVVYGRKRWFLTEPDAKPNYDPDETTLKWWKERYPKLGRDELPLECVLGPGELIYFPNLWWHATLNLQSSVFISTFLSP